MGLINLNCTTFDDKWFEDQAYFCLCCKTSNYTCKGKHKDIKMLLSKRLTTLMILIAAVISFIVHLDLIWSISSNVIAKLHVRTET